MQMAIASKMVFEFSINQLPVLKGVLDAMGNNMLTRGDKSNRIYTQNNVVTKGEINLTLEHLVYDPQTSGGLLISVPESNAEKLLKKIQSEGDEVSAVVGRVISPDNKYKAGTIIFNFN
jgi:selenide,water dikinase